MTNIRFDHFITYTSAAIIDDHLKKYAAQGFTPEERTVRHEPGLRNGFIYLGVEYIEFCWVEDEEMFAAGDEEEKPLRTALRPFGIGMISKDVQGVHNEWTMRSYSVPAVWSKAPRDAPPDAPPAWSFQEIPSELLPGANTFVLTYHNRKKNEASKIRIHPNTIYAVSKITFVVSEPEARATRWRNLLAPDEQVTPSKMSFDVMIGAHQVSWMSPDAYLATYNRQWTPAPHPYGELAVLHLLATDLPTVKTMMENAGRRITPISNSGQKELFVEPDERDGFTFIVQERSIHTWLQERMGRTGEAIEIEGT